MSAPAWFFALLAIAILGFGMVTSFFLTFSDFLMRSLKAAKPETGVEIMQIINREVLRSITIVLLWSMLALSVLLASAAALSRLSNAPLGLIACACAIYVAGVLVVSFARNLPMNEHLGSMPYSDPEATRYWQTVYLDQWVFWNTVRVVASAGSAVCLLASAWILKGGG